MMKQNKTSKIRNRTIRLAEEAVLLTCVMCFLAGCGVPDAAYAVTLGESGTLMSEAGVQDVDTDVRAADAKESTADVGEYPSLVCVYVCGAVEHPGVVELPEGSRAADALLAVGGFAADAQTDYVNLAAKVSDGERLYFPTVGEVELSAIEKSAEESGLVNINTADVDRLCTLPGIGTSRAQDIIDYREANGAFQSVEDIMKVAGIKTATYEKLREKITVQ
ncbi:MAG: helix-hairpin-helix domain-containing protein [Candidatus Gastranaerophilales bacterium]|nr:helix-hairpin-helix domain-containing protein [Candidatus Gastranaerophilales bacterium]